MYDYNAGPAMAIPIYTAVLPYCVINPFSFDAYQSYNNAGHNYKINAHYNTGADAWNKFSPLEDFFVNPFNSDVISPNQLCTYIGTGAG